jgi:uncharacterized protein YyaL (SSP411 family)
MSKRIRSLTTILMLISSCRAEATDVPTTQPGKPPVTTAASHRTNRLIHATSPYLLQHAHNPVDWYEWGPDALEKSRKEDKPIFLSIGYSACHWCHVMERESFENEEIAAVLNEHFVAIKVDREERPDLDEIYMTATQAMTQSGGWPMSVWLTPDQKPFYAGTYFPPDDHYGRPGFKRLLLFLADVWKNQREKATQQADNLTQAIRELTRVEPGKEIVAHDAVLKAATFYSKAFDPVKGGMSGGGTNKFPPSMAMDVMLRAWHHAQATGENKELATKLLGLVELTLDKMAHGGIYDHLGGGIARYSTDTNWLVPHFEKMLYDQALVSDIYLKAFQATGNPLYARVAGEILDYVIADLQSPEGGYYCTRDADSEGHEGKFYVWTRDEVDRTLGKDDAAIFCDYYDVTGSGNWEGVNILNVPQPIETVAKQHNLTPEQLETRLVPMRRKLFDVREKRIKPHLDDKILASWNGLMIASMARGYRILGQPRYRQSAERAAVFVTSKMTKADRLQRTYRQGKSHTQGYLDDHAFMIEALINLYEATFELRWLREAQSLNESVVKHFRDAEAGGFFFTADDAEKVLVRTKDASDGATPSGNSVQLMNLLRLSLLLDRKDFADEAERVMRAFGKQLSETIFRSERMLAAIDFHYRRPKEIAFVFRGTNATDADKLIDAVWRTYVPNLTIAGMIEDSSDAQAAQKLIPLLAGKKAIDGRPTAYVCKNFACSAPTGDAKSLQEQIRK